MIYLDNGATSFHKPAAVRQAVLQAMEQCANPGRGGYPAAMAAAGTVYRCREAAAELFDCEPEQVVFTSNCTHGLNIAIQDLVKPGGKVVIGRKLIDWENILEEFENALREGADAAVFTHVSNVFGYILPVEKMAKLCRQYEVPFILDAAQSAGCLDVHLGKLGAEYIAMPGHKGLLGPQGTGLLLCGRIPKPLTAGGTGSDSVNQNMPDYLPDRLEAGTVNVPGIAGLAAGLQYLKNMGAKTVFQREHRALERTVGVLKEAGFRVFSGAHQAATVSFVPDTDCEEFANKLAKQGIAVRAGLHCAPLAHESAGTLDCGTVRVSFGIDASYSHVVALRQALLC